MQRAARGVKPQPIEDRKDQLKQQRSDSKSAERSEKDFVFSERKG